MTGMTPMQTWQPHGWRRLLPLTALAVLLVAGPAAAQVYFPEDPSNPPSPFFVEDFDDEVAFNAAWSVEGESDVIFVPPETWAPWCMEAGRTGLTIARDRGPRSGEPGGLLVASSLPGATFDSWNWTNFRMEYDVHTNRNDARVGFVWSAGQDTDGDGWRDDAYIFYIHSIPHRNDALAGARAQWTLIKRQGGTDSVLFNGAVTMEDSPYTVVQYSCYRLRLEWFCDNLRVRIRRIVQRDGSCSAGCSYGCGASCTASGDPDQCWCDIVQWSDASPLPDGASGIYSSIDSNTNPNNAFDNFVASSWLFGPSCGQLCSDSWDNVNWERDGWAVGGAYADQLPFKFLYEGALSGFRLDPQGAARRDVFLIDPDGESPPVDPNTPPYIEGVPAGGFCNGWRELVDLPGWTEAAGSNLDEMLAYLEPTHTAVRAVNQAGSSMSNMAWQYDCYDPDNSGICPVDDPPDPNQFNPIPVVALGKTPLAGALMDAYNWYVEARSPGGDWADDPFEACRLWYVVLITDGEEICRWDSYEQGPPLTFVPNTDAACEENEAAQKFASLEADEGLDPVPVYIVGFSEGGIGADISCVSTITGGQFLTAATSAELGEVLNEVISQMEETTRAFLPVTVSPPPQEWGGGTAVGDFLVLVPQFIPRNNKSIWDGHLYAFVINGDERSLPFTGDGQVDVTPCDTGAGEFLGCRLWDANASLYNQLRVGTATRNIYWVYDDGSSVTRMELTALLSAANADERNDFRSRLDQGSVSDGELDAVVNFMRYYNESDRPTGTSVLGDIYHSKPVVVRPPNDIALLQNNVNDYIESFVDVHAHRRRVALFGANDGMLHAVDAGYWNRDTGLWANTFDLGTGTELFAHVPHAPMHKLFDMVHATKPEQAYTVDGNITVGDVYITPPWGGGDEWRTVALYTMRRGGRGVVALDVTQPDGVDASWASSLTFPECLASGTSSPCNGNYPTVLWEFTDDSDEDGNCPLLECEDLGNTWSTPAIARIKGAGGTDPDELYVAFFGGGHDQNYFPLDDNPFNDTPRTGKFFYAVNIETGEILYKENMTYPLPAAPSVLDEDLDGFADRLYFTTSGGGVYRIDLSPVTLDGSTGRISNWSSTHLYDLGAEQMIFTKPVLVPSFVSGAGFLWGLAFGSGDRANVDYDESLAGTRSTTNRFYFVLDNDDGVLRGEGDLVPIALTDGISGDDYLKPADGSFGWYLILRENEKVNADAIVAGEVVYFPTFQRTDPDDAGGGGGGGDDAAPVCSAVGAGRLYQVYFNNGDPADPDPPGDPDDDGDDHSRKSGSGMISGGETFTIGDRTYVWFTTWEGGLIEEDVALTKHHEVTNWRQE